MSIETFIKKVCVQKAVYWGNPQDDGYGGKSYDNAVEISVRWNDENELITLNNGKEYTSKANILVTQNLDVDGFIYLGHIDDLTTQQQSNPKLVQNAFEIKAFTKIPMIKQIDQFVRTCYI